MSTTIISVVIMLLSQLLPYFGVEVGSEELTQAVTTLIAVGAGIWIWYRRVMVGDISVAGVKK